MANDMMDRQYDLMDTGADRFFDRLAHNFFGNALSFPSEAANAMKTDIAETPKAYTVTIDLPGLKKENININYDHDVLTVSGKLEHGKDDTDKDGAIIRSERQYGQSSRQYRLPNIDQKKITANYDGGVLKINLPKSSDQNSEHKIEIN
ncbi:Hsp20/alpha crystallin family protein [Loigolactobacillus backii]|uniref:Heat-shock protein Hsp20 n=1 Tax=Loigolactobacillus backii TaxID=375175 RepID=A0A192GZ03_9LACO|nr:Hsp20/alpha crystallin family protein [Loigolactobacillus backii]ANK60672.1 heat-shock protein Hsp20 [Loigolactobacillus backii]ANK61759.1 heat-shock protein Hsp20 [Loigolactobacillus backii]ANK65625.1 heat-shock protein Hsp20 [Loigolactobacillus backii]ANK68100.1 heat-shock protein Hsp20 [Loigolactobacillus backii]ANK69047.1 heat-shock protein Hsp20 [Loigolactobacillus backii]